MLGRHAGCTGPGTVVSDDEGESVSEADNAWRFEVDGQEHDVEVEHSTLTGKVVLRCDGKVVDEDRLLWSKKEFVLDFGGHAAEVTVDFAYGGFAATSKLRLDGRHVEPLIR